MKKIQKINVWVVMITSSLFGIQVGAGLVDQGVSAAPILITCLILSVLTLIIQMLYNKIHE